MNKRNNIRLLDCTLRDGGHINQGKFGKEVILNIIKKLVEAKIDIIEFGFLWDHEYDDDTARYYTIADAKKMLPENRGSSHFCLMADFIDLENLEPCDGIIEYIRLSFKRNRLDWAIKTAKILIAKGYKVYINPVNCNVYTDEQYLNVIHQVNELHPFGFSIVDTFGVMRLRDLTYRYSIVEKNLDGDITIGLHLHENLGLSYSLAQQFLQLANPQRKISIDGSLLGMGRAPGNLCIEQIMDHLNCEYGAYYNVEPVFDAIDDYIAPIKKIEPWGYAIPYALSAKYNLHRTYAEFLMNKWKLRTSDIERILPLVKHEEAELFNEAYIEGLYREYVDIEYDDYLKRKLLSNEFMGRQIVLIAPGASINENAEKIKMFAESQNALVIGIHCVPDFLKPDYVFFSNIKRYEVLGNKLDKCNLIISSNLMRYENFEKSFIVSYHSIAYHGEKYCDDSVLMMLNLLTQFGFDEINIAGFDGVQNGKGDFYIDTLARFDRKNDYSADIYNVLKQYYSDIKLNFLTSSYYNRASQGG